MKDERKAEEIAVERIKMLGPLLEEEHDKAKVAEKKREICERYGISERTLRRYLSEYRKNGFSGLKPKQTGRPGLRSIPEKILKEAIQLRREVPGRSVNTIIQILEWEKKIEPGTIKRSTLQEHLAAEGYSSSQMRIYRDSTVAARRFQRVSRNSLWQSDIKFGPYINGKQVYLVAYNNDKEPLRFLDTEEIAEAFLRVEERKVDKSGCISFNGEKYEIENGLLLIGRKVNVIYERSDTEHLWIEHENFPRTTAKPLVIGERAGQRPPLPQMIEKETVSKSRLLDAAEKINKDRDKVQKGAISFRIMGGGTNV